MKTFIIRKYRVFKHFLWFLFTCDHEHLLEVEHYQLMKKFYTNEKHPKRWKQLNLE